MRHYSAVALAIALFAIPLFGQKTAAKDDENALIIVFKDGRQQKFSMSDIARIEFSTPKMVAGKGQNRFLGKWRVGDGAGSTFFITLEPDGAATKSIGASHGTWTAVGNEARISWDDGWHDAIRKVGNKFEKAAFAPGKSFSDKPNNVTGAENTEAQL